jgi:hypothetical protein
MGLFDFMFEDDGKKKAIPLKKKEEEKPQEIAPEPQPITPSVQSGVSGEVNEDIKEQLTRVLLESNIQGYDYLEFRDSINNMASVIPSEPERFKAAFAAVSSIVTVEKLVETADFYLSRLASKKTEFEEAAQGMYEQNVTAKEGEISAMDQSIAEKQEQITKLNQEISELQQSKIALQNDAITEKAKIEKVNLDFNTTYDEISRSIEQDKTKISTYLGAPKAAAEKEA